MGTSSTYSALQMSSAAPTIALLISSCTYFQHDIATYRLLLSDSCVTSFPVLGLAARPHLLRPRQYFGLDFS
jgi:hypothetical protein